MAKRIAIGGLILVVGWLLALVVIDIVVATGQGSVAAKRIGESLQGTATIGETDLALVRGTFEMKQLAVHRDDVLGHLALEVGAIECQLAPLGGALFDRSCRELEIRGVRLEVSTAALFQIKRQKQKPIRAHHVAIDDAVLTFAPSAFLPSLGQIKITVDHAEAGPTVLVTPLSWIFAMTALRAHVDVAGLTIHLTYKDGIVGAAGSLFGSRPVELPLQLPAVEMYTDAHAEIRALVKLGTDLAEGLVAKRAEDWLRQKL